MRKDLEDAQNGQTMLIDKLITCCKEVWLGFNLLGAMFLSVGGFVSLGLQIIQKPNAERTQRLFASLREELERKGPRAAKKPTDGPVGS